MAKKSDFKAAQERIFARPRPDSKSDQELLRKTEDDGVYPSSLNVKSIRVERMAPDLSRPPHAYSEQALLELGRSLLAHGQIMPVLVQYEGGDDVFLLLDGERRWLAAQKVGLQTLQAIVIGPLTPLEREEKRLAAALHQNTPGSEESMQALEHYRAGMGLGAWADVAGQLEVGETALQHRLHGNMLAAAGQAADDGASHIEAAIRLVETMPAVHPEQGDRAQLARLLDRLAAALAVQRGRLARTAKSKVQTESKGQEAAGDNKPVRHLPTWGQR